MSLTEGFFFLLHSRWYHITRCLSYISFQTTDRRSEGSIKMRGASNASTPAPRAKRYTVRSLKTNVWTLALVLVWRKSSLRCAVKGKVSYKRCPVQSNLLRGNSVETGLTGSSELQETMTWEQQPKSFSVIASTPFYAAVSIETRKVKHGQCHIRLCVFHFPWWERGNPVS